MKPYFMKAAKTSNIPSRHLAIATVPTMEAPDKHGKVETCRLHSWAFVYWDYIHGQSRTMYDDCGTDQNLFWRRLEQFLDPHFETWIWGHFLYRDLTLLNFWELVESKRFVKSVWVLESPPTILRGVQAFKPVCYVDLQNWVNRPLVMPNDDEPGHSTASVNWQSTDEELSTYAGWRASAVFANAQNCLDFVYDNQLGDFQTTIAGQSMRSYRTSGMGDDILHHSLPNFHRLEFDSFVGGQVSCFRLGEQSEPLHSYDVNGLFPYCMANYPIPTRPLNYSHTLTMSDLIRAIDGNGVIARVRIDSPDEAYPERVDNLAVWSTGRFWATLCGPELCRAIDRGHVKEVSHAASYHMGNPFSDWVNCAWERRMDAAFRDKPHETALWKSLMNSLYGKFAQRLDVYKEWKDYPADTQWGRFVVGNTDTKERRQCRAVAGVVEYLAGRKRKVDTFPAVSAFTTSYARVYMDGLRAIAGFPQTAYQCVDELHVTSQGRNAFVSALLVDPLVLGKLKKKWSSHATTYAGCNMYLHDGKLVCAGVPVELDQDASGRWFAEYWQNFRKTISQRPDGTLTREVKQVSIPQSLIGRIGSRSIAT